ncbi:MAG: hypothetical protein Kow0042_16570 [Calditrichia bacterium]
MSLKLIDIPLLTAEQMREVDRLMVDSFHIQLIQMMEIAGRNLAEMTRRCLSGRVMNKKILIAVGKGNNGGGGLVAARHLSNWGASVCVLAENGKFKGVPEQQWKAIQQLPVEVLLAQQALNAVNSSPAEIIIDALIGYGLSGAPTGFTAQLIRAINQCPAPVLALDTPSGLEVTTGEIFEPCIQADITLTLGLPKTGLVNKSTTTAVGQLFFTDIGIPPILYKKLGFASPFIFENDSIIDLQGINGNSQNTSVYQNMNSASLSGELREGEKNSCILLDGKPNA